MKLTMPVVSLRSIILILAAPGWAVQASRAPAAVSPILAEDFETGRGALARVLLRDRQSTIADGEGVGGGRALRVAYVGNEGGSGFTGVMEQMGGERVQGIVGQDLMREHRAVVDVKGRVAYFIQADREPAPVDAARCRTRR